MTNIEHLKSIDDENAFASELYAIIKSFNNDINYVELNNALEAEHKHITLGVPLYRQFIRKDVTDDYI